MAKFRPIGLWLRPDLFGLPLLPGLLTLPPGLFDRPRPPVCFALYPVAIRCSRSPIDTSGLADHFENAVHFVHKLIVAQQRTATPILGGHYLSPSRHRRFTVGQLSGQLDRDVPLSRNLEMD